MKWIWIALGIACMTFVGKVISKSNYQNQGKSDSIIKQPYWYFNVGIAGLVCFNFIGLVFLIHQQEVISWLIMVGISLLYIPIMIFERNWRVEFSETSFTFTNMFGKKKEYLYSQVTLNDTGRAIRVCFNKTKVFSASFLLINVTEFEKAYKKATKKK